MCQQARVFICVLSCSRLCVTIWSKGNCAQVRVCQCLATVFRTIKGYQMNNNTLHVFMYTYLHISLYIFIVQVDEHRGVILECRTCAYC